MSATFCFTHILTFLQEHKLQNTLNLNSFVLSHLQILYAFVFPTSIGLYSILFKFTSKIHFSFASLFRKKKWVYGIIMLVSVSLSLLLTTNVHEI